VMIQGQRFADLMASLPQLKAPPREGGDPYHAAPAVARSDARPLK
jgi:hypothetical protein